MSSSSTDYYQYLKYIKNAKLPPVFLSENGGATSSAPMDFTNHNISLNYENPLKVNENHNLTLDLSVDYTFDSSNICMTGIPLVSGDLINENTFYVTIDNSGRLGYQNSASINSLTNMLSKSYIVNTLDMSNQILDNIQHANFYNELDIRQNDIQRMYTLENDLYLNPAGSLIMNGNNVDLDRGSLINVTNLNGAFDQDISIQSTGYGNISLHTETYAGKPSSLLLNKDGNITMNGNVITIGDEDSIVNIFGTTRSLEITNTYSSDHIITLNKDGTAATTYGCGFQIESAESDTPVGYIKTSADGMTYDVGVPGDVSTNYTMLMTDLNGNLSTIASLFSINEDRFSVDMKTGDASVYGTLTSKGLFATNINSSGGEMNVNGNINLSGTTIVRGTTRFMDSVTTNSGINIKGDTRIAGNTNIGGNIDIVGDTNVGGTLDVVGDTTFNGNTDISGHTNINGDTNISGITTISGIANMNGDTNIGGTLDVSGCATIYGDTIMNGLASVTGNANINGNINISGDTVISGNGNIRGNTNLGGDLIIGGNTAMRKSLSIGNTFTVERDVCLNGENIKMTKIPDGSQNMFMITYDLEDTKKIGYKSISDFGITELREEMTNLQAQNTLLQARLSTIEKMLYINNIVI